MDNNIIFALLANENQNSTLQWEKSCNKYGIKYDIIDLTASDWLEKVKMRKYDCFLLKPPGEVQRFKDLYNERVYIISKVLKYFVYPTYEEIIFHENKKLLAYFLEAENIPHPNTKIYYSKKEAYYHINNCKYPIVGKTSIGASGSGVKIINNYKAAKSYVDNAFSKRGIKRRFGPNRKIGSPVKWFMKTLHDYDYFKKRLKKYFEILSDRQIGLIIFQEYICHDYEWRIVKIGQSYFGHKKTKIGEMASGTKGIDYVHPQESLLTFVKNICDKYHFNSMAVDIFEHKNHGYVINEMQTIFGHVQNYIMKVGEKIGRYVNINGEWIFEEGDFNTNESYDLRVNDVINLKNNYQRTQK